MPKIVNRCDYCYDEKVDSSFKFVMHSYCGWESLYLCAQHAIEAIDASSKKGGYWQDGDVSYRNPDGEDIVLTLIGARKIAEYLLRGEDISRIFNDEIVRVKPQA